MSHFRQYVERPLHVAHCLHHGKEGASYLESTLLLSAVMSMLASSTWPGTGLDRARFVELATKTNTVPSATTISVPLLRKHLRSTKKTASAEALTRAFPSVFGAGYGDRILTWRDVDMDETEIGRVCPTLSLKEIRSYSYAAVFYKHVRSAVVHEHQLSAEAAPVPMTGESAAVSYVNYGGSAEKVKLYQENKDAEGNPNPLRTISRQIHFSFDWMFHLIRTAAEWRDLQPEKGLPKPPSWWIEG